ncbi:MAG: hypothetical protein QM770_07700 [Tepidisphaeraceae bacterium]
MDSLDLGFHVNWNERWPLIVERFAKLKADATGSKNGIQLPASVGHGLMRPGGRAPAYAFHLVLRGIQVWIARTQLSKGSPNVYVSLPSDRLWHENIAPQVRELREWIEANGGTITDIQVSRADIAADFELSEPLTSDFLKSHLVTRARKRNEHAQGDTLQTFYVGQGAGAIQLRIYDKIAEIVANGGVKNWFFDLWKVGPQARVWRVEFQLRRLALKQFGIRSLEQLPERTPKVWNALTEQCMVLREPDDSNKSRRSVHPWWAAVQSVGELLGSELSAVRDTRKPGTAPTQWYVSHGAGCVVGYAARTGTRQIGDAIHQFMAEVWAYWNERDFDGRYRVERLKLNLPLPEGGVA